MIIYNKEWHFNSNRARTLPKNAALIILERNTEKKVISNFRHSIPGGYRKETTGKCEICLVDQLGTACP